MIKLPSMDTLLENRGWKGLVARSIAVVISYIFLEKLPQIYTWGARTFFSENVVIDERRHIVMMYFADALVVMAVIFGVLTAVRLIFCKRKSGINDYALVA